MNIFASTSMMTSLFEAHAATETTLGELHTDALHNHLQVGTVSTRRSSLGRLTDITIIADCTHA